MAPTAATRSTQRHDDQREGIARVDSEENGFHDRRQHEGEADSGDQPSDHRRRAGTHNEGDDVGTLRAKRRADVRFRERAD